MSTPGDSGTPLAGAAGSPCAHREQPAMGYAQCHEDADRRLASGEQQFRCRVCGLYVWSEFWRSPNAQRSATGDVKEPHE